MTRYGSIIFASALSCLLTLGILWSFGFGESATNTYRIEHHDAVAAAETNFTPNTNSNFAPFDFTFAADKVSPAVVFIRNTMQAQAGNQAQGGQGSQEEFFRQFFGAPQGQGGQRQAPQPSVGAGSGVLISADGYIVTNNHVIDKSIDLEVRVGDKDTYKAILIGTDPTTDIALLKIEGAKDLPFIEFADSDQVRIGQWVAAVGNPFDLETTVTAGIVSALGRSINIIGRQSRSQGRDQTAIESFIQTDAAVNPGNSGGALVNTEGNLIGINTAIASPTGAYTGYSFAVPSRLVRKVVDDLREFGTVQRGFIGASIVEVDQAFADDRELEINYGVYIAALMDNSSAKEAGLQEGDIIVEIDGNKVRTSPELLEQIGRHRPGDAVRLTYLRDGTERSTDVILKTATGTTEVVRKKAAKGYAALGIDVEELDDATKRRLRIDGGVKVADIRTGRVASQTDMAEGFIITVAGGREVNTVADFMKEVEKADGMLVVKGRYETMPGTKIYAFELD
ncbi:MAG: Do family serine endopeptidase [Saprospiraceae bacterium]